MKEPAFSDTNPFLQDVVSAESTGDSPAVPAIQVENTASTNTDTNTTSNAGPTEQESAEERPPLPSRPVSPVSIMDRPVMPPPVGPRPTPSDQLRPQQGYSRPSTPPPDHLRPQQSYSRPTTPPPEHLRPQPTYSRPSTPPPDHLRPALPQRPVSPALPQRPTSPALPQRPASPSYTEVPDSVADDVPPPSYEEAMAESDGTYQFTPPFSNTGGDRPYPASQGPPPPTGPRPQNSSSSSGRTSGRTSGRSSVYPGRANLTYGTRRS